MKSTISGKPMMTRTELVEYLGVSWNTIQKYYFKYEDFPRLKVGNKWMFNRKKVDEFLYRLAN